MQNIFQSFVLYFIEVTLKVLRTPLQQKMTQKHQRKKLKKMKRNPQVQLWLLEWAIYLPLSKNPSRNPKKINIQLKLQNQRWRWVSYRKKLHFRIFFKQLILNLTIYYYTTNMSFISLVWVVTYIMLLDVHKSLNLVLWILILDRMTSFSLTVICRTWIFEYSRQSDTNPIIIQFY